MLSVWSSAIETTFPLSNFKTKHIFGILIAQQEFLKFVIFFLMPPTAVDFTAPCGAPRAPQFFFPYLLPPPKAAVSQMGAEGAPNAALKAPLPRRAREIPPKAGFSRVIFRTLFWLNPLLPTSPLLLLPQFRRKSRPCNQYLTRSTGLCIKNPNASETRYEPKQRRYEQRSLLVEEWDESKSLFQKHQPVPHQSHHGLEGTIVNMGGLRVSPQGGARGWIPTKMEDVGGEGCIPP